jgi:hypothetical protein
MDRNSLDILLAKNEIHSNSTLDAALLGKFEKTLPLPDSIDEDYKRSH